MTSNWTESTLGEFADLIRGVSYKPEDLTSKNDAQGISLLRATNIKTKTLDLSDVLVVPSRLVKDAQLLRKFDVLIAMSSGSRAAVGRLAQHRQDWQGTFGAFCGVIRPKPEKIYPEFLGYLLYAPEFRTRIDAYASGTAIMNLTKDHLLGFPVNVPPIAEQVEISKLLGAIDDRIKLLHESNAVLDEIVKALFKSWFVDFEPVCAKFEGRLVEGMSEETALLFPDAFDESELGRIPKGWQVSSIGNICSVTIGGLWGKDTSESTDLIPAISLRGVDLEHLREFGYATDAPVRWVKSSAMDKRRLSPNEVLIASSGAGPCGRALWAGAGFESLYELPVIFSNFVKRLDCGSTSMAIYIDRILAEMRESKEIWNYINGTSIPNLDDKLLLATKKIVIPPNAILDAFADFASTIYARLYSQQAQALTNLRDTLLPRLISGQLRIADAEAELEKVTA